jgi:uncharacterized protein
MKIDLNELAGNLGKNYHYKIREDCKDPEYAEVHCVEKIIGSADFTNTGSLIIARGSFRAVVEVECARCLTIATMPVEVTIEEQFPIKDPEPFVAGGEEEIIEEDIATVFSDNIFDLSEFIRQSVLVQVPIQPLCSEACKGLCLTCGKNLNEGPCDCPVEIEDSPFSALQQLLGTEENGEQIQGNG